MFQEEHEYFQFCGPQTLERDLHVLEGILKGIAIDNSIKNAEMEALIGWCDLRQRVKDKSPFNELIPVIETAVQDGVLDDEERADIEWLCKQYTTKSSYYNKITSDMQRLHGMLAGIAADGVVTELELSNLQKWLNDHEHLRTVWPFDEIDALITDIMSDDIIDEQEQYVILNFCEQFLTETTSMVLGLPIGEELLKTGVCSAMPDIDFEEKTFCLSGTFDSGPKSKIADEIKKFGGSVVKGVRQDLSYLIIGGKGNSCWAFSCYGRKVEKAMGYRKKKLPIQIVHEFDLRDAIEDCQ